MKIHLAAVETMYSSYPDYDYSKVYTLSSFFYLKNKPKPPSFCFTDNMILDSGAFSFFGGKRTKWDSYVDDYIRFINETDKKFFFELDIDSIVGIKEVEAIRRKITQQTSKNPIPVWHPKRGLEYYKRMVHDFDYVALSLSGRYTSSWVNNNKSKDVIYKLLEIARQNDCKVHGLGFTKLKQLKDLKFYSVDSTSWLRISRFGDISVFNNGDMVNQKRPDNTIMINPKLRLKHGFDEWVKYQRYAENNL